MKPQSKLRPTHLDSSCSVSVFSQSDSAEQEFDKYNDFPLFFPGHNNMCNIISPTSLLLSATGTLAFKNCGLSEEVSTFTAPEMLQGRASSTKPAVERVSDGFLSLS